LAHPLSSTPLARSEFIERLAGLHYVMFPFREGGYYTLSASGTLVDAITWLKPVIATPIPMVRRLFDEFGDIGFLFRDDEELRSVFDRIMSIDETRYRDQVAALERARETRTPQALAARYVEIIKSGYDGLLCNAQK
jgi:glycosyltransferase involved in cell wall biosynthesis